MRIIHFHTDARMAMKFVAPLMAAEQEAGHQSELVSSVLRPEILATFIPFDLSLSNLLGLPWALWRIFSYLKVSRPQMVFSHNTKSSLLPLLGAWLSGVQIRVYFNHGVPYAGYQGSLRVLLRALERLNCALASHVVTVSSDMRILLQDVNPQINPYLIHNGSASGIDLSTFSRKPQERNLWRQEIGLSDEDLVVVFIGRPEKRKGFELVLQLWTEYFKDKNIKLVLCGPQTDEVKKYIKTVPSNVIALGFVNNIPEILASSDLMILPSLHEGLSYACLEAQAAGVVVIANDISGIRCVIEDGKTGFLVAHNDLQKYAEIIKKIETDRNSIEAIKLQAKVSVSRFSREQFIPSYLSFVNSLIHKSIN